MKCSECGHDGTTFGESERCADCEIGQLRDRVWVLETAVRETVKYHKRFGNAKRAHLMSILLDGGEETPT